MTIDVERIRAVAAAQLGGDVEAGAALCVMQGGRELLCEAFGLADATQGTAYTPDSLQITMSMAKGVLGALVAILMERGQLDPGRTVASYWPEFAANGKQQITVAQLLSHQAGLPALEGGLSLALVTDRPRLAGRLAAQAPLWAPGSRHGYHAVTLGHYADLLFERASGQGVCSLLAELRGRTGLELHCGLPEALSPRAVRVMETPPAPAALRPPPPDPASLAFQVLTNFPEMLQGPRTFFNGAALRAACLPATNMFASARSLARLYAGLLAGGLWGDERLASPAAVAAATALQVRGADVVTGGEMAFALGFQKPSALMPFSPNPRAYGHCGVGGSVAFADPDAGLALAWTPSRLGHTPFDARMQAVVAAVYAAL